MPKDWMIAAEKLIKIPGVGLFILMARQLIDESAITVILFHYLFNYLVL
jgi:hypothetical protein